MFDTYIRKESPSYPQRVDITEKRAPTDESVRLLREMQVEAEKDRIGAFHLESNNLRGVVEVWRYMDPPSIRAHVVFELNGQRHKVEAKISAYERDAKQKLVDQLHKGVAEKIATEALIDMLDGVRWPQ